MDYLLLKLKTKSEVDDAIKNVEDKVLVLQFRKDNDIGCMEMDNIIDKVSNLLKNMAEVYTIDIKDVPVYAEYFEVEYVPATVFFFNGEHIKVDYGGPDHTKFIGSPKDKQTFIDLVETVYRGAMAGKHLVVFSGNYNYNYDVLYKNI